jgi:tetratricopeptide (TPR) repeat protein
LLILPINQNLFYDYPIYNSIFSVPVLASLALHSFLILSSVILLRRSNYGISPADWSRVVCQRLAALGIAWFYIALAVESSFVPIRDVIFEHRVYLPSAGLLMTISVLTALAVRNQQTAARAAWALLAVCCLILGGATVARNQVWGDSLTLWQDTAKKSPYKGIVQANLAVEYLSRNMPEKSLPLFVRAIELNPNLDFRAKTGIGASLQALRVYGSRFTTGEEYVLQGGTLNGGVLDYGNVSKWESVINNTTGLAYEYLKEPEKALKVYEVAVTMNPAYDLAWYNLAILSSRQGNKQHAAEAIEHLKTINPPMAKILESTILLR